MSTLAIPKVNLNGNTKESLVNELRDVYDKLSVAAQTLENCEYFNGRNFQIQSAVDGGVLARKAREEHYERVQTLGKLRHEILELAYDISQQ